MAKQDVTRREFVRKIAYVAPAIVTLAAAASYAKAASLRPLLRPTPVPPRPISITSIASRSTTTIA